MAKRSIINVFAVAATLTLSLAVSDPVPANERVTLRLDFAPVGLHAPMHLAKEKGWFESEGIDIDIQDGTGTLNTLQLVGAGQIDVGQVQLGLMLSAREAGMELKAFAGFLRRGDLALLVPRDSGLDSPDQLAGHEFVCFTASPWVPFIDSFLAAGGLSQQDVTVTMVSPPAMGALYSSGEADGFFSVEHYAVPLVENTRPAKAIRLSDYGINIPSYGLLATEQTLNERHEVLGKIARIQARAWGYVRDGNIEEAVEATIAQRPNVELDPDILRRQLELSIEFLDSDNTRGKPIGWQSREDWEHAVEVMTGVGALTQPVNIDEIYTNDLLTE
jgi:NitT/TauT family transport system substrate-binding protein